jgi:CTP synthase
VDAVCIPGGFGVRGIEGKISAVKYAREHRVPILGLCLGLQCMVIETARNLSGIKGAGSSEFDENTPNPVISTMAEQVDILAGGDLGGTMRLGLYPAVLAEDSLVRGLYAGAAKIEERHRHRYEVNNAYREKIAEGGLRFSGTSPDGRLVEFIELPRETHPYFVATQAHPELRSRPTRPHPLFVGLVAAAVERQQAEQAAAQPSTQQPSTRQAPAQSAAVNGAAQGAPGKPTADASAQ